MLYKKKFLSPLGSILIIASDKGVNFISFENREKLHSKFSNKTKLKNKTTLETAIESQNHPILLQCEKELKEYFKGKRTEFSVLLDPQGTEFQKNVWAELVQIPYGKTVSYLKQADKMGRKSSVRAVAAANSRNPIAIIIPCHRVIASTGYLHGYAGGLDLKRKLLEREGLTIKNLKVEEMQ